MELVGRLIRNILAFLCFLFICTSASVSPTHRHHHHRCRRLFIRPSTHSSSCCVVEWVNCEGSQNCVNRRYVVCLSWTSDGEQGRPGPYSPSCDGEHDRPWTLQSIVPGLKAPSLLHESPCCSFVPVLRTTKGPTSVKVSIALVFTSEWYQTQTACCHSFSVLLLHLSDNHTRQSKTNSVFRSAVVVLSVRPPIPAKAGSHCLKKNPQNKRFRNRIGIT